MGDAGYEALRLRVLALDNATKSQQTRADYRGRVKELGKRFDRETGGAAEGPTGVWAVFINWLIDRKLNLSVSTWRQYKSAVIHTGVLLARQHQATVSDMEATLSLAAEAQSGARPKGRATSANKLKRFPERDLAAILGRLQRSPSQYAPILIPFLHAGLLAGLRPAEWAGAEIIEQPGFAFVLKIRNAKDTHDRAHGPYRHLRWRIIAKGGCEAITVTLSACGHASAEPRGMDALSKGLQRLLRETCYALWPRRKRGYTLYDCRHDFAARAKLVYEPAEVAALMGHASDETATRHYGRMQSGGLASDLDPGLPEPDPAEVARVRSVLDGKRTKLANISTSAGPSP
jgi:integrase